MFFSWLADNYPTVIVCLLIAAAASAAVIKIIKDRRNGRRSCGSGCSGCPMADSCHKARQNRL